LQCEIILAGSGKSLVLLQSEFPNLQILNLPNHGLKFLKNLSINSSVILQSQKLKSALKAEHRTLKDFLLNTKVDGIISDNRYGIFTTSIHSVLITHQISRKDNLRTGEHSLRMHFTPWFTKRKSKERVPSKFHDSRKFEK